MCASSFRLPAALPQVSFFPSLCLGRSLARALSRQERACVSMINPDPRILNATRRKRES